MSSTEHLFVDLDGTLVDARARQVAVMAEVAARRDWAGFDGDRFWSRKREGDSTRISLQRLAAPSGLAAELAGEWQAMIEDRRWLELDEILPGAIDGLRRARSAGMRISLLTARRDPGALLVELDRLRLTAELDQVIVVDPARAAVAKAHHLVGARIFVGDTESDARAAATAAIPFIGVTCGQRSPAFLSAHGVSRLAASFAEAITGLEPGSSGGRPCRSSGVMARPSAPHRVR